MNKFMVLALAAAVAVISAACAETGGQTNPGASIFTAPSSLAASSADASADADVSAPTAKGGGGGGGKPGGGSGGGGSTGGSGSITLRMVTDANADGLPNWGDSVTFDVSTASTTKPMVSLTCSQSGGVVYVTEAGFYASYLWPWLTTMTLRTTAWQSGAANCLAKLYYYSGTSTVNLTSISFTAGA